MLRSQFGAHAGTEEQGYCPRERKEKGGTVPGKERKKGGGKREWFLELLGMAKVAQCLQCWE